MQAGFEVALLDGEMREAEGVAPIFALREQLALHHTPILFMLSRRQMYLESTGEDTLLTVTKPVKRAALRASLLAVLPTARARWTLAQRTRSRSNVLEPTLSDPTPISILLVEDNITNQRVALRILERLGHKADVAHNGNEAIAAIIQTYYDLVLMDLHMPEMDGLEATRYIRDQLPAARQPMIVAITAAAMQEDAAACLAAGMNSVITKPVQMDKLTQVLADCAYHPANLRADDGDWSRTKLSTPGGIRTPDSRFRRPMLCSAELQAQAIVRIRDWHALCQIGAACSALNRTVYARSVSSALRSCVCARATSCQSSAPS